MVERLSDNGSGYIAHETRAFARYIGLIPRRTPYRSPQSNGMAESFVKTFKRDYVPIHAVSTAEIVLKQLPTWFTDYNLLHPHRALKYRSPEEFRRDQFNQNCLSGSIGQLYPLHFAHIRLAQVTGPIAQDHVVAALGAAQGRPPDTSAQAAGAITR